MTESKDKPKRLRGVLRMLVGVVVALALGEAAFCARDRGAFPHLNVYEPDEALGVRLRPGATQRLSFGGNPVTSVRINAQGFRGGDLPPPSDKEIVVVGDSQVFGLGVEEGETFSTVLAEKVGRPVVNAGVPTYGPMEYAVLLERLLRERKPKSVVYVVNLANDLFEAERPNTERHTVWDGWAVRVESAPTRRRAFPGRDLLYRRSHAVFAMRKLWYGLGSRQPERDDRGFASEGTFRDMLGVAEDVARKDAEQERERIRRARLYHDEIAFAERRAIAAQVSLELLVGETFGYEQGQIVRAARANPGDIVAPAPGEEARPILATAIQIKQGAVLRERYEAELRKIADKAAVEAKDAERSKTIRERLEARDVTAKRLADLRAAPLSVVRASMPIVARIVEVKRLCDASGAELVVLVLPLDVQVSEAEWAKYGTKPVDMEPTKILLADLVGAAADLGAKSLDASSALSSAEPGAFLDHDLHMTPKGHRAVAEAIAGVLASTPPPRRAPGLPLGRSRAPRPEDWAGEKETTLTGSTRAGCETKRVREWLRVACSKKGAVAATPTGVKLTRGGHGDAIVATWDGVATLVAPVLPGDRLEADFFWADRVQHLVYEWPADAPVPLVAEFDKSEPVRAPPLAPPPEAGAEALCACHKQRTGAADCKTLVASADVACTRTYAGRCDELLACASGNVTFPPRCEPGYEPAGAMDRCRKTCSSDADCAGGTCSEWQGLRLCGEP